MMFPGALKNYKILVVDDDAELQEYLRDTLDSYFALIMIATTSQEAKSLIGGLCQFDAIICDYQLPDSDGLKLYEWLREEKKSETPFLMISGHSPRLPEGSPHFDYLAKPFQPNELIDHIKALLSGEADKTPVSAG